LSHRRKPFQQGSATATAGGVRARAERAASEGRFQQALELAKHLYKYEPTPAHLELLKKSYLGRARQLQVAGFQRDAATVLEAALRLGPSDPAWLEQIAAGLAGCGAPGKALELLKQIPTPSAGAAVVGRAADAAVELEAGGRGQLPSEWHADFDRVLQVFKQHEAGQDEAAKETLQGIGLKSPFLEWKLFLRGLQAYYQSDDARAVENWSRLDRERLPARLAAPLRCHIDRAFRDAQPPLAQAALRDQFDRLQGNLVAEELRRLRGALSDTAVRTFAGVFRQVEALLPTLRAEAPDLIPRLAACCYWAVLDTGPDDALRYKRVFGAPHDDPTFHRLQALGCERFGDLEQAHQAWQAYEREIGAAAPSAWPPDLAARARALIWLRMGKNAAQMPSPNKLARLPRGLREAGSLPEPLKPGAEKCFDRCIALAPDMLEPYEALYQHHEHEGNARNCEKAARRLLERFPEHVPTLTALGATLHHQQHYAEALELYQRALKANPLDRKLRTGVSVAHVGCARLELETGHYDAARAHLRSALAFNDNPDDSQIRCRCAALEFKAGNSDAAEEHLREARQHAGADLPVSFRMLTECARLKLSKQLKARFDREVRDGLIAPATAAAVLGVLELSVSLRQGNIKYFGQKTHEKRIVSWAEKARGLNFHDRQYVRAIVALMGMDAWKPAQRFAEAAAKKYKQDPEFAILQVRILLRPVGRRYTPFFRIRPLLSRAEMLLHALPRDDERLERLSKDLADLQRLANALDPWGPLAFPNFFGPSDDDDADDDNGFFDEL
jgi:tetratricopeptide (TPR) repeat protein